ncbi:MAG: HDOD domain-containing protein [Planctomycetota bacterium]
MALSPAAINARLITAGLPTFPRTVSKLTHLITVVEAPAHVVASVIATDPAITALIIGQANAAGHVTNQLNEAIRRIGMGVVLTTAQQAIPVDDTQRKAVATCWAQANAVAVMMPILYDYRSYHLKNKLDNETLHIAGLIHDLGHVLAITHFTAEYARACVRQQHGEKNFDHLITTEIGSSPRDISTLVAKSWAMPKLLAAAMINWRDPASAGEFGELSALLNITHSLVKAAGFIAAGDRYVDQLDEWSLSALNLRLPDFEIVLGKMFDSMDELELYEGALGG